MLKEKFKDQIYFDVLQQRDVCHKGYNFVIEMNEEMKQNLQKFLQGIKIE